MAEPDARRRLTPPASAWGLLNAFTRVLGPRAVKAPAEYAAQTKRLTALLAATPEAANAA